jgi:pimeloyl-ACP methyl ester carboxylesterase
VHSIEEFLDALKIKSFAIYLHDFGAPVGMRFVFYSHSSIFIDTILITRIAMNRPEAVTAYIVQNGNIYSEGWSSYWDPVRVWWSNSDPNLRTSLIDNLQPPHIKGLVSTHLRILCSLLLKRPVSGKLVRRRVRS